MTARTVLDPARIIAAAIAIADELGLDGASMRAVAERLEVTPMALYKHVANRSALVDGMLDRLLADITPPPAPPESNWQAAVRARILAARSILTAHPWARDAIEASETAPPHALAHMNALMAAMFEGGLSADLVHLAMHALSTRMMGFTRDVLPMPALPVDPAARASAMLDYTERYPAIIAMATDASRASAACDEDAEFAFSLDLILDGIQRRHEAG